MYIYADAVHGIFIFMYIHTIHITICKKSFSKYWISCGSDPGATIRVFYLHSNTNIFNNSAFMFSLAVDQA